MIWVISAVITVKRIGGIKTVDNDVVPVRIERVFDHDCGWPVLPAGHLCEKG
jgi:hypothetical protein